MVETATGWKLGVDRGPDWMFVRVHPPDGPSLEAPDLADAIWSILQQNLVYRVVLELDEIQLLRSYLLGQLILLSKRVLTHGGSLRLCGLTADNSDVLHTCRLEGALPSFANRNDAVKGFRPHQPR